MAMHKYILQYTVQYIISALEMGLESPWPYILPYDRLYIFSHVFFNVLPLVTIMRGLRVNPYLTCFIKRNDIQASPTLLFIIKFSYI